MGAFLALMSALIWGTSDFAGGTLSRHIKPLVAVLISQSVAMVATLLALWATGGLHPNGYLLYAVLAGVVGPIALMAYYRALAIGPMGIVGPISATAGLFPVLVGLIAGERISHLQMVGLGGCVVGVAVVSASHISAPKRENKQVVLISIICAVGFGVVFVSLAKAAHGGVIPALAVQKTTTVVLFSVMALFRKPGLKVGIRPGIFLALVGILDVSANGLYALSSHYGQLAIVGALGSVYPLSTTILAATFSKERLSKTQLAGAILTLAAVALASS